MPTIELYGFSSDQLPTALAEVQRRVADLPFAHQLVLAIDTAPGRVLRTIRGDAVDPFLRIATGAPDRAAALEACLAPAFDLEILAIRFCPRTSPEHKP